MVGVFWSKFRQDFPDQYRANTENILKSISNRQLKPQISKVVRLEEVPDIFQIKKIAN